MTVPVLSTALDRAAKLVADASAIVSFLSAVFAALATVVGAIALYRGRPLNWADCIGVGAGVGALVGLAFVIGLIVYGD